MHLWNCQVASLIWQPLAQGLASLLRSFTCGSSSQFFPLWRLLLWACGIVTVLHLWRSSMKPFTCCHRHCHRHCSDIAIVFLLSSCRCHNLIFTLLNPEWLTWWSRSSGSGVLGLRCFAGVSVVKEVEKKNAKLNKCKKSKKKKKKRTYLWKLLGSNTDPATICTGPRSSTPHFGMSICATE